MKNFIYFILGALAFGFVLGFFYLCFLYPFVFMVVGVLMISAIIGFGIKATVEGKFNHDCF